MNEDQNGPAIAHSWRHALYGQYIPSVPRAAGKSVGAPFVAFLGLLGQMANADGYNGRLPGTDYIARGCRISRDSVRRFYEAAAELGVITITLSANGRYVESYNLVTIPVSWLRWDACVYRLRNYKRLDAKIAERESGRQDSAVRESESRRHDSLPQAPQNPSPDVRHDRVLTSGWASPDVMRRPGDDHEQDHDRTGVSGHQEVRAGVRGQEPIPEVEEKIVGVPVTVRPWTREEKQQRVMERLRLRPDAEIAHLAIVGQWHALNAREQTRYLDVLLPASQKRFGSRTVEA